MADTKKYLDLNGLGYTIRKMDAKKADIESPAFTGTPTINNNKIVLNQATDDKSILIQSEASKDTDANVSIISTTGVLSLFGGEDIRLDANGNIYLKTYGDGIATYNGYEILTEDTLETKLDAELDDRLNEVLEDKAATLIEETVGARLDEKADIDSPEFTGIPLAPTAETGDKSLQIANTQWVDNNYIGKQGDAVVNGSLTVTGNKYPLLTLKPKTATTSGYLMNIQGNLMFGDCTSNNPSRQYYGRMVPALNQAIVGAVAIGYNPKDNSHYQTSTDYGIKIDVDTAASTSATPTIKLQCASFFVGANGGYIGYSGSVNKAINYDTQVYRILDSNSIKSDEYVTGLEQRIADLETKLASLLPTEEENS